MEFVPTATYLPSDCWTRRHRRIWRNVSAAEIRCGNAVDPKRCVERAIGVETRQDHVLAADSREAVPVAASLPSACTTIERR